MIFAYRILFLENEKVYIGVTDNPARRFEQHIANAFQYNTQTELYSAMRQYGPNGFDFEVIAQTDIVHKWELERQLIAQYNSFEAGYNMTQGGRDASHLIGKAAAKLTSNGRHIGMVSLADPRWELCEIETVQNNVNHGFDLSKMKINRSNTK